MACEISANIVNQKIRASIDYIGYNTTSLRKGLWTRDSLICPNPILSTAQRNDLQRKYQNQILSNNQNTVQLTKKQLYARLANGHTVGGNRRITYASQTDTATNSNIRNLSKNGNSLSVC